jgi:hypothetical protein
MQNVLKDALKDYEPWIFIDYDNKGPVMLIPTPTGKTVTDTVYKNVY